MNLQIPEGGEFHDFLTPTVAVSRGTLDLGFNLVNLLVSSFPATT
jgi:hypothetical protein